MGIKDAEVASMVIRVNGLKTLSIDRVTIGCLLKGLGGMVQG